MSNGLGTGRHWCICVGQRLHLHSPGSTFLHEMTSRPPSWKNDGRKIWFHQSTDSY